MSMQNRECRNCTAAVAVLVALVLLVGGGVLLPWWAKLKEYDDKAVELTGLLERYRQVNARKSQLEAELQAVRQRLSDNNYYLAASTPALAAAELQKQVKQVVEAQGAKLVSTQNIDSVSNDAPARIAIRVRMSGDVDALTRVLHELEGGRPLLFVENMAIRSLRQVRGRGRERTTDFSLDINFDLVGYLLEGTG